MEDIIQIENLTVDFDGYKALSDVNMKVAKGELRFLIGPNGAGKTTILDVICGKVKPVKGTAMFKRDINLLNLNPFQICRKGISRKFQTPSIFGNLSVFENMELSLTEKRGVVSSLFHRTSKKEIDGIFSVLNSVNLDGKHELKAGNLSHGEKQWLEIAMTMIQEPSLLLVDEPVAGMTVKEREYTGELLKKISGNRSVIVVEHDMLFVEKYSDTVTVLHGGRIICEGTFDHVKRDSYVIEVYFGRSGGKHADY
jgi:urea transport system ATP-binding protein